MNEPFGMIWVQIPGNRITACFSFEGTMVKIVTVDFARIQYLVAIAITAFKIMLILSILERIL